MSIEEVGVRLCNLLLPGDPQQFVLALPASDWTFDIDNDYSKHKQDICNGQCAVTYAATREVDTSCCS